MDLIETSSKNVRRHPWELSRAESIIRLIDRKIPSPWYADIGCGDAFFSNKLLRLTGNVVYAVDPNFPTLHDNPRLVKLRDISELPKIPFDGVFLLDVLEHIEDDGTFLSRVCDLLGGKGRLILTVPAFQFLFSNHDLFLKHRRRYNFQALSRLLDLQRVEVVEHFYFYTVLFWLRFIEVAVSPVFSRKRPSSSIGTWKYPKNHPITVLVKMILNLDFFLARTLARINLQLPGLSLCVILKTKSA